MPNINIAIDEGLLRRIRVKAAAEDMTRRALILQGLERAVMDYPEKESAEKGEADGNR